MNTILVIEDNLLILENIAELLELSDYRVITAENGKKGVEQALLHQPDLILSDIMMPELDGYEVLQQVQSIEGLKHIPFIFLSAKAERTDFRKGMGLGADDYLSKPFAAEELLEAVDKRLQKADEIKQQQDILVQQEKLRNQEQVRYIMEIQDKERQELSEELRDHINQMLTSCKLMMEIAAGGGAHAQELNRKTSEHLNEAIDEIKKISENLNFSVLHDIGLMEAVTEMVQAINSTGKLHITFTHRGCSENNSFNAMARIAIYYILQERLKAIIKEGRATEVAIHLSKEGTQLQLSILENGEGVDIEKVKKELAFSTIKNRVESYKGSVIIDAEPGKGIKMKIILNEVSVGEV